MTGLQCWENQAWGGDQSSLWDHPSRKDRTFSVEMQLAWVLDVFCLPHLAASCRESRPSCFSCCCRTTHPSVRCLKARGPFSLAVAAAQGRRGPLLRPPEPGCSAPRSPDGSLEDREPGQRASTHLHGGCGWGAVSRLFLTAPRLGPKGEGLRELGRTMWPLRTSEVTWYHFQLLVKAIINSAQVQSEKTQTLPLDGKGAKVIL